MKKIFKISLAVILIICISSGVVSALSKMGSRSSEVRQIQTILKQKGYYSGNVDGIFGLATKNAVIAFQRDNGLVADGIAGSKTLTALGIKNGMGGIASSDYELLARIISAEARGEVYLGQVAVGAVIMNRIEHPSFPDTLSGVVYQKGAFSCLYDGQFNQPVAESAYLAASDVLNGLDPSGGAIYYYNPKTATSKWIFSREVITTIGNHRFCK
ncbi:MAG: spore cortex-lytic enzyme [Ruminococcaceae bacterium]|nr:spore cortex-lytic enzyme [Oscillospiraceae bacterium]